MLSYKILFQNVIKILPTTYQNKSKMPGNIGSPRFICKKWEVILTIQKPLSKIFGEKTV